MICSACGEENREGVDFCALCHRPLAGPAALAKSGSGEQGSGRYRAPGEWHGELAGTKTVAHEEVSSEVRRFRFLHLGFYIVLAVALTLVALLTTVWGTKTPAQVTRAFLEATAAGDADAALALIFPSNESTNQQFYSEWADRLSGVRYERLRIEVDRVDQDISLARITGGTITSDAGTHAISPEDGLGAQLRMHKGLWYIYPAESDFLP
ncbi:MAG: hypothetical protein ACYC55_04465 [Candidatus Geothermincolia bacterium]